MTGNVPRGRIRRTMPVAGFTARAAGGRMVAALREKAGNTGAVERFHERTAEQYAELLGHSKGVLMKAGQLVSMVDADCIDEIASVRSVRSSLTLRYRLCGCLCSILSTTSATAEGISGSMARIG